MRRLLQAIGLVKQRPAEAAGKRLFAAAAAQARQPAFYLTAGVPDTYEGRFELYSLHVVLVLHRLKRQGEEAAETSQAVFDAYVANLDLALREMGVGDLSVGKKMRKLGEAFYGRAKSYDAALSELPETGALRGLIARTVFSGADPAGVEALCDYVVRGAAAFAAQPLSEIYAGKLDWPAFPATETA